MVDGRRGRDLFDDEDLVRSVRVVEGVGRLVLVPERGEPGADFRSCCCCCCVFCNPFMAFCILGSVSCGTAVDTLAIAIPEAASAPARPVGLRLGVEPRRQDRFFLGATGA